MKPSKAFEAFSSYFLERVTAEMHMTIHRELSYILNQLSMWASQRNAISYIKQNEIAIIFYCYFIKNAKYLI